MEPRSDVRLTRTKPRFVRGVVIGDTDLTATELTNLETVANLSADDLAALAESAEALEAIGTYEGATDIATDLATVYASVETASTGLLDRTTALETSVDTASTGLLDRTTALETSVDTASTGLLDRVTALEPGAAYMLEEDTTVGTTYYYSETPTEATSLAITAGSTAASIAPGGSTAWDITVSVPATNTTYTNVLKVYYSLGTHTGALTIGGVVVTGSGVLHFFWNGTAYVTWNAGTATLTIPDKTPYVLVSLVDGGVANTLTLVLPAETDELILAVSLTADADAACNLNLTGDFLTGSGPQTNVADVATGVYLLKYAQGRYVPIICTTVTTNGA